MQLVNLSVPWRLWRGSANTLIVSQISTLALLLVLSGLVADAVLPKSAWATVIDLALLVYLLLQLPALKRLPAISLTLALGLAAVPLLHSPQGWSVVHEGLQRASHVAGILAAMGLMVEAARTSSMVREVGYTVISRGRSQRYLSFVLGSHLLSIALNIGTLNLLASMVQRVQAQSREEHQQRLTEKSVRETSQAIMRGFNSMPIWSPLAIGFAVTTASIPGLNWQILLPWAIAVTFSYLLLGWLMDGIDWGGAEISQAPYSNWQAVRQFLSLIGLVLLAATSVAHLSGTEIVIGTIVVVPLAAILWLLWQYRRTGKRSAALTMRRLRRRVPQVFPQLRTEICMVGGGALLGSLLAHLLHLEHWLPQLLPADLSPLLLAGGILLFILVLAQTGFGAIVGISIIASALPDPRLFGLEPLALAVVFLTSWGIAAGITPSGATISIIARVTRVSPKVVAYHWNGRFTLIACVLTLAWVAVIQWLAFGNFL